MSFVLEKLLLEIFIIFFLISQIKLELNFMYICFNIGKCIIYQVIFSNKLNSSRDITSLNF